ncbi:XtrA/YqaO family protein [Bacillus wiedmannii]|uniref:XtrA/YqaO family protein n=1 Tax=Bacillus wiedmannii TaxID=1890302 RepID=UPI00086B5E6C|nr:XtrA/YqaO family protein [Bacillus wiedmannii]SCN41583.1 Uncharacterized protein BCRIVMBC938_05839 [Bacillus wiedmannii]
MRLKSVGSIELIREINKLEFSNIFVIIVNDGNIKLTRLPEHGETKIITHQGKVKRIRFDEGEDF